MNLINKIYLSILNNCLQTLHLVIYLFNFFKKHYIIIITVAALIYCIYHDDHYHILFLNIIKSFNFYFLKLIKFKTITKTKNKKLSIFSFIYNWFFNKKKKVKKDIFYYKSKYHKYRLKYINSEELKDNLLSKYLNLKKSIIEKSNLEHDFVDDEPESKPYSEDFINFLNILNSNQLSYIKNLVSELGGLAQELQASRSVLLKKFAALNFKTIIQAQEKQFEVISNKLKRPDITVPQVTRLLKYLHDCSIENKNMVNSIIYNFTPTPQVIDEFLTTLRSDSDKLDFRESYDTALDDCKDFLNTLADLKFVCDHFSSDYKERATSYYLKFSDRVSKPLLDINLIKKDKACIQTILDKFSKKK